MQGTKNGPGTRNEPGRRQGGELAAGTDQTLDLTMRLYVAKSDALTGKWNPPPVTKVQTPSFLQAQ